MHPLQGTVMWISRPYAGEQMYNIKGQRAARFTRHEYIHYSNVNESHTHLNLQARVRLQPKFGERRVALSLIQSDNKEGALLGKYRYLI